MIQGLCEISHSMAMSEMQKLAPLQQQQPDATAAAGQLGSHEQQDVAADDNRPAKKAKREKKMTGTWSGGQRPTRCEHVVTICYFLL